jgi:hypothetical protein
MPAAGAELGTPNDSYAEFMKGLYEVFKKPFQRVLGGGVNETIDASLWTKWSTQPDYRPQSVEAAMLANLIEPGSSRVA